MIQSWILASASPRRKEILEGYGIRFTAVATDVDETTDEKDPERLAEELAERKGLAALATLEEKGLTEKGQMVIASDTTVSYGNEIMGKPESEEDAFRMLSLLQGKTHRVVSGIFLALDGKKAVSHEVTEVTFDPMTEEEIRSYIRTGEPFGKAGAYAVQGIGNRWISGIRGDYYNVVGLPIRKVFQLMKEAFDEDFLQYVKKK